MSIAPGFYATAAGNEPADIELRVCGLKTFQIMKPFVYIGKNEQAYDIPPQNASGKTTDLASVPPWLWGLIASYGRQLAPALLHDHLCDLSDEAHSSGKPEAYQNRRLADHLFREALQVRGVSWFRSQVFWSAVTFDRYKRFRPILALAVLAIPDVFIAGGVWIASLFGGKRQPKWPTIKPYRLRV